MPCAEEQQMSTADSKSNEQSRGMAVIATGSDVSMLALQPLPSYLWATIYLQAAVGEAAWHKAACSESSTWVIKPSKMQAEAGYITTAEIWPNLTYKIVRPWIGRIFSCAIT